ncbi:hypothetical protein D3C86_1393840 [compost metagenome]
MVSPTGLSNLVYRDTNHTRATAHGGERILLFSRTDLPQRCGKTNPVSAQEEKDICRSRTPGLQALLRTIAGPVHGIFIQSLRTSAAD